MKKDYFTTGILFITFLLLTVTLLMVDRQPIGPNGSVVGCATLNNWVHNTIGTHMMLYTITDLLSIPALLLVACFGLLGFVQMMKRKSLWKVDGSILVLGGFYIAVMAAYLFFEKVIINYRPVLIEGELEASYPSSTTMLVICVTGTAIIQFSEIIHSTKTKSVVNLLLGVYLVGMVVCRLISGVHWITDIFGGILLSLALIMLYVTVNEWIKSRYSGK